ncbi:delta-60 repeat domain-containing protein [Actinoplanes sp. NBRC 103695]|uniref:delta-60 repeat domain-containing protein n=1 Tax=Actinoplanes sp. NBRC 103695 TaxID=3032202 RepID=UPI0024A51094|nr:delta-60 repeat domain-containing protein [Actinoplanes sp. NBRC 103695]GLY94282.1 hypothetical protein Acsp02_15380 [Actinoplanes sp. NBRC 103695]
MSLLRRLLVPAAVTSLVVGLAAAPASAVYVPPPVAATIVSANPVDWTPHFQNGDVRAFAQIGNTVYAGGSFTGVKAPGATAWTTVSRLVAYDASTGALRTGFTPTFDNHVQTLAVSPDGKLIVGGNFGTVNGVARKNLVEIDPATGATITGWIGRADGGVVRRAIVHGNQLYIAGAFHWVNGTEHSLLARLNATTGAIDGGFQVDASGARPYPNSTELVWALAVSPDGDTVVATGNFTSVNGASRNQVVMIDVSGVPAVADWSTDQYVPACASAAFPFYARDVDFSDDGGYFVIAADGGYGATGYCDAIARFETSHRGAVTATWVDSTGADSVTSIEAADGLVYVGGHFRWLSNANGRDSKGAGGIDRYGFGALDPNNGLPVAWNPGRSPGDALPPGGTDWGPIVWELWKGPGGLFVGQDSDGVALEYHGRQALFPTTGGRTIGVQDAPSATSGYLYRGPGTTAFTKTPFNGTTLGATTGSTQTQLNGAKAGFSLGNKVYYSTTAGKINASVFSGGAGGTPWEASGFNSWFNAAELTGAFYLNGRMYMTVSGYDGLWYRYFEPDGSILGCTLFQLPTSGVDWSTVRGLAWVNGKLVFGSTSGALKSVAFNPGAATAVVGSSATTLATSGWTYPTLFFATS